MILKYKSAPVLLAARDVISGLMSSGLLPIASMTPRLDDLTIEILTREESAQTESAGDDMETGVDDDGIPFSTRCKACGCYNGNHNYDGAGCEGDDGQKTCDCSGFVPVVGDDTCQRPGCDSAAIAGSKFCSRGCWVASTPGTGSRR